MSSSDTKTGVVEVTMPQMGVSVAEGTIVEWQKRPGDWVEADETIALVSTDKVDVEIPAPVAGRLERILVEVDETVAVGTALAEIDAGARPGEAHPEEHHEEDSRPETGGPRPRRRTSPTAAASIPRSSGGWPQSTASTSRRSRGPGSAAGSARRTWSR